MKLRRLEVEGFRCLRARTVLERFDDGVTLIVGDNEEGKSTILAALQTVLFEKFNVSGAVAEAMLPYGEKIRPEIALDFEHDGIGYRLTKAFCQRAAAELTAADGGRWQNAAAEERLREMLEFTPPGRGASRADNRGLQALFWVEQGATFAQPHINDQAQLRLSSALEAEVGTVTGGERGRALIERVRERLETRLTPRQRKPTGDYAEAQRRVEDLRASAESMAQALAGFEAQAAALARARQDLLRFEADRPIEKAADRWARAQAELRRLERLEQTLETERARGAETRAQRELAEAEREGRQAQREALADLDRERAALGDQLDAARQARATAEGVAEAARAGNEAAREGLARGRLDHARARQVNDLLEARARRQREQARLADAEQDDAQREALQAALAANALTAETLRELRDLQTAWREARARLEAAATRLTFEPDGDRQVRVGDRPLAADGLTVSEPTRIELEGFGSLLVSPGGESLAARRGQAEEAERNLREALERQGVADMASAERLGRQREQQEAEQRRLRDVLAVKLPDGMAAQRARLGELEATIAALQDALEAPEDLPDGPEAAQAHLDAARHAVERAESAERAAAERFAQADGRLQLARERESDLDRRGEEIVRQHEAARSRLEAETAETSDAALEAALAQARDGEQARAVAVADLARELAAADPAGAREEFEAADRARQRVDASLSERHEAIARQESGLQALGANDTAAELEIVQGKLAREETRLRRLRHEAEALELLLETLSAEERASRERFLAPVVDRATPYLRRLFPATELVLDDSSLAINGLRRDGREEPYERLSIGTREQIAVLARLAFADLLRDHGKPSPIVLDDALVYADDRRFEEMQHILDRAAAHQQILILTCHERAYLPQGWHTLRLAGTDAPDAA